jgi:transcriptional regulator with XRE-family HTH domain
MRTFAQKIKEERKKRNLTQTEFGAMLGVTQRMILEYETAGRRPHKAKMCQFAKILELPYEYLRDDAYEKIPVVSAPPTEPEQAVEKTAPPDSQRAAHAEREMAFLKERCIVLFSENALSQTSKDAFFRAIYDAYFQWKNESDT